GEDPLRGCAAEGTSAEEGAREELSWPRVRKLYRCSEVSSLPRPLPSADEVWRTYDAMESRLTAPLSERMLDLARVGQGMRVLDLATGQRGRSCRGLSALTHASVRRNGQGAASS